MSKETTKQREGLRFKPYRDSRGILSIGYGRNLDDVGISEDEAEYLFNNDYGQAESDIFAMFPPSLNPELTENRRDALIDMRFQMGPAGFRGFKKMIQAIHDGDWERACNECLDSQYKEQATARAWANATALRNG